MRNGHSGVVSIIGEPGAGKSRLADEIIDPLEGEAIIVRTACAPYGELDVWAPVVTGLTGLLAIDREVSIETLREIIEHRAEELWGLQSGDAGAASASSTWSAYLLGLPPSSTASTRRAPRTPSPPSSPRCCDVMPSCG